MAQKGCRAGKRYGTGLNGRTQEYSKLREDVNLMLYLKLWLPFDENKGGPIFRKVLVTRFGRDETKTDPASEQHDPKPYNFFKIFFYLGALKK